jgi:exodeoxyribonuclease V gamma subunit
VPPAVIVDELREALAGTVRAEDRPGFLEALETVHPRQAFDESCFVRGRLIEDGVWGFDGGDLAGAQARRRRPFESPAFLRQPLHRDVENPIALSTLHRFLQNPVKMFVEQRLGVRLPRRQESVNDRLPVAPGGLQKWQVGQRLLDCVLEGVPPDDWARVERRLGTVPPAWLGESFISEIEQSVARLVGEAMASGWQRAAAVDHPIDVDLGHGLRIVGSVPGHLAAPDCGPARIMFTRGKPVHRVAAWLDLMALMAMDPTRSCRSLVVARGPGSGAGVWTANLVPRSDVDGGDAALEALRVIVRCFEQGSTEPIPLFPSLSYRSYLGQATPNDWTGSHGGRADGDDPATGLVFGGLDFRSLMALEVEPGDPVTAGGRVAAFAHYLYGAMEASVEDMAASPSKRRR